MDRKLIFTDKEGDRCEFTLRGNELWFNTQRKQTPNRVDVVEYTPEKGEVAAGGWRMLPVDPEGLVNCLRTLTVTAGVKIEEKTVLEEALKLAGRKGSIDAGPSRRKNSLNYGTQQAPPATWDPSQPSTPDPSIDQKKEEKEKEVNPPTESSFFPAEDMGSERATTAPNCSQDLLNSAPTSERASRGSRASKGRPKADPVKPSDLKQGGLVMVRMWRKRMLSYVHEVGDGACKVQVKAQRSANWVPFSDILRIIGDDEEIDKKDLPPQPAPPKKARGKQRGASATPSTPQRTVIDDDQPTQYFLEDEQDAQYPNGSDVVVKLGLEWHDAKVVSYSGDHSFCVRLQGSQVEQWVGRAQLRDPNSPFPTKRSRSSSSTGKPKKAARPSQQPTSKDKKPEARQLNYDSEDGQDFAHPIVGSHRFINKDGNTVIAQILSVDEAAGTAEVYRYISNDSKYSQPHPFPQVLRWGVPITIRLDDILPGTVHAISDHDNVVYVAAEILEEDGDVRHRPITHPLLLGKKEKTVNAASSPEQSKASSSTKVGDKEDDSWRWYTRALKKSDNGTFFYNCVCVRGVEYFVGCCVSFVDETGVKKYGEVRVMYEKKDGSATVLLDGGDLTHDAFTMDGSRYKVHPLKLTAKYIITGDQQDPGPFSIIQNEDQRK